MVAFDPVIHCFGSICKNGHNYLNSQKSLRYKIGKSCVQCVTDYKHKRAMKAKEHRESLVYSNCPYPQKKFNQQKHIFGEFCKHKHDWGNGYCLRYLSDRQCVCCKTQKQELERRTKIQTSEKLRSVKKPFLEIFIDFNGCPEFNKGKYKLGKLCKKEHDFFSGTSLRYVKNSKCVQCSHIYYCRTKKQKSEQGKIYYQTHKNRIREEHKIYYHKNKAANSDKKRAYREANKLKTKLRHRHYFEQNKEKLYEKIKAYRKTPEGLIVGAKGTRKYRAIKKGLYHVSCSVSEINQRCLDFDNRCAYCGIKTKLSIDHFIPVSLLGADCLGNYIPACKSCNSSKHNSDPKDWYKQQPFYSRTRWSKILKVLGLTEATYTQMPLF